MILEDSLSPEREFPLSWQNDVMVTNGYVLARVSHLCETFTIFNSNYDRNLLLNYLEFQQKKCYLAMIFSITVVFHNIQGVTIVNAIDVVDGWSPVRGTDSLVWKLQVEASIELAEPE